jgi:phage-related protein
MRTLPTGMAAEVAKRLGPLARIHLFDIQRGDGSQYFWASHEGVFLSRLTGTTQQYKPWIKTAPTIKMTRSLRADGGQFTIQNLSGNTIDREVAALFEVREFEGAYVIYRPWRIPLDAAPFEFHGFITEQDVEPEQITVRILQLFQPNEQPAYDRRQTRGCGWRFTSAQCGYRRGQLFVPATMATTYSANTIGASGLATTPNLFNGELVMILSGTGAGQERYILSHTATTFTLKTNWTTNPDSTSKFIVTGPGVMKVPATTATIFSSSTIGASGLTRIVNQDLDASVFIISGTGAGQNRAVTQNSATTFTIAPNWTTNPDGTSVFIVTYRTCAKDLPSCTQRGVVERFSGVIFLQPQITSVNGPTAKGTGGSPIPNNGLPPVGPGRINLPKGLGG